VHRSGKCKGARWYLICDRVPSSPIITAPTRSPYSLDVVHFFLEAFWTHLETRVLAIVIPARLLSTLVDVMPFLLELDVSISVDYTKSGSRLCV